MKKNVKKQNNNKNAQPKQNQRQRSPLDEKALYFVPLGGSEQFGVNLNVYIANGDYLAVDCGLGFADDRFPGIDLLLPDPAFLEDHLDRLKGLIITHAHEDHIGAVAYLWKRLQCPIYTTEFTANVLRAKLADAGVKNVPVHVVPQNGTVKLGAFSVQFIPVAHSVPDAAALVIETSFGCVLHSGDWNLDHAPLIGKPTSPESFKQAGDKGILAYIGDSTNAGVAGRAGSESEIEKGLVEEFRQCKGRVAITIFSSNISRIIAISRAAQKTGRKIAVVGRSLHRMVGAAHECGHLKGMAPFLDEEDVRDFPANQLVMIVTGSQGEFRSALAKIARGEHRSVKLSRDDTVIFSSRAIPGNERAINDMKNNLSAGGVRIVTPSDTDHVIHVSGHPCRDEIIEMYGWVRPEIVIPVHGERVQLEAQASLARECQIKNVIVPANGSVIKLAPGKASKIDHVETGLLAVDQKRIIASGHVSISDRRKLQFSGVVHLSLVLNAQGEVMGEPKLDTVGLIDEQSKGEIKIEDRLYDEMMDILDDMNAEDLTDDHFVEEELRIGIRRFVVHTLGIKPKTTVHVLRI